MFLTVRPTIASGAISASVTGFIAAICLEDSADKVADVSNPALSESIDFI